MVLERYDIDPGHSGIQFSVRHLMISKVRGRFTRLGRDHPHGTRSIRRNPPRRSSSTPPASTPASSRGTPTSDRAKLPRRRRLPDITYRTKRIERVDESHFNVVGDLTIRGVTREVPLQVEYAGRAADPYETCGRPSPPDTSINRQGLRADLERRGSKRRRDGGPTAWTSTTDVEAIRRGASPGKAAGGTQASIRAVKAERSADT